MRQGRSLKSVMEEVVEVSDRRLRVANTPITTISSYLVTGKGNSRKFVRSAALTY